MDGIVEGEELQELWESADKGDWERLVTLMGGLKAKRKDFPVSVAKQWNDKPNRYREPTGEEVIGVIWERIIFPTRIHQWIIKYKCESSLLKDRPGLTSPQTEAQL